MRVEIVRDMDDAPPLPKNAGRRQRNQLRRSGEYPAGNEPKPWSKRTAKRGRK